jgi:FMN reductase [NAD(P)H]
VFLVFVMDGYRSYLSSEAYDGSFDGFKDSDTLITLAKKSQVKYSQTQISRRQLIHSLILAWQVGVC